MRTVALRNDAAGNLLLESFAQILRKRRSGTHHRLQRIQLILPDIAALGKYDENGRYDQRESNSILLNRGEDRRFFEAGKNNEGNSDGEWL